MSNTVTPSASVISNLMGFPSGSIAGDSGMAMSPWNSKRCSPVGSWNLRTRSRKPRTFVRFAVQRSHASPTPSPSLSSNGSGSADAGQGSIGSQ